ncbi:helix-turn-helix domain-containing protein [Jiulongibacter sp. NS-SX5]|uniref:helix-turn-helix domain-containing protein n=1 Tax=Jiulongibacter sp. NS-SX5 TaxID=3463854 RepID=UPI0040596FF4
MTIQEKTGCRLKEIRQSKSLSQEALGFEANVHRTYINDLENGRRNVSVGVLERILIALEISFEDFFKGV